MHDLDPFLYLAAIFVTGFVLGHMARRSDGR